MKPLAPIPLAEIEAAARRIDGLVQKTPLVPLNLEGPDILLKLENLQPIGSFKLRGAGNALLSQSETGTTPETVITASAGNMAQGVAWSARSLGIRCKVVVPEHAPATKLAAINRLGGEVISVSFEEWWNVIVTHRYDGADGYFVHPVADPRVIAGNGTIGLEILESCPDFDSVVVPYGGGGLSSGIASAVRARRPEVKVYAAEVETAAPFAASLASGKPVSVERAQTFVDGIGGKSVLPEMWPLVSSLLAGSLVVSLAEVAEAIRLLATRNRIVAEGAGGAAVAAAIRYSEQLGKTVAIVSGGNIETGILVEILSGGVP